MMDSSIKGCQRKKSFNLVKETVEETFVDCGLIWQTKESRWNGKCCLVQPIIAPGLANDPTINQIIPFT